MSKSSEEPRSPESDSALVRRLLWEYFPERRDSVLEMEAEEREFEGLSEGDPVEVGAYSLISDVFVFGVLKPALAESPMNVGTATRCAEFLERLLGEGKSSTRMMVNIRVTSHLLGYPDNWGKFQGYAGALLRKEVREQARYYRLNS